MPEGWKWVKLENCCEINPSSNEIRHLSDDTKVTFVPMTAVSEVTGRIEKPEIRLLGKVRKGHTYFREGDVLFAKITPCMENGKAAIARNLINGIGFGSTEFHVLRPLEGKVISEWIHYYVRQKSFRDEAARNMTGSVGQQRVPVQFIKSVKIPLPPLEEQERIVSRLNELVNRAEEAKRLRRQAREEAEKIMQAALNKVFSRAEEEGWKWVKLSKVLKEDRQGVNPQEFSDKKFFLVTMDCIESNSGKLLKPIECYGKEVKSMKYKFNTNHILYGKLRPYLNKVYVPDREGICTTEFIPFIVVGAIREYVAFYLRRKETVNFAMSHITGTRQPRVILGDFLEFLIPLPPLEEQRKLAAYLNKMVEEIEILKMIQQKTEEELEKLVPAILDKAFRGGL
ncbi:MAG: restriction endonuclease subunit S [Thermoproteota archaeon]